jgi:hypothetical protein
MAELEIFLRCLHMITLWIFIIGSIYFFVTAAIVWFMLYSRQVLSGLSIAQIVIDTSPSIMLIFGIIMLCGTEGSPTLYIGASGFVLFAFLVGKWARERRFSLFLLDT